MASVQGEDRELISLSESAIKFSLPPIFVNQRRLQENHQPSLHERLRRHDEVCTKNQVVKCYLSWADGMKMNTRILLSPVLEVANEKLETNPKISTVEFGHLFIECVEQTLTDLLGAKVREALLDYLARHDRLTRGDILGHPRELSLLLDKIYGKGGTTIERYIIRRLYAILEWEYKETSNFNFSNQLEEARACWKASQDAGLTD